MTTLIEEKSNIQFRLYLDKGEPICLGSCSVEVLAVYAIDESPVTFRHAPLLNAQNQPTGITLTATVTSEKGPVFAQMRGAQEHARHTDQGMNDSYAHSLLHSFLLSLQNSPLPSPHDLLCHALLLLCCRCIL